MQQLVWYKVAAKEFYPGVAVEFQRAALKRRKRKPWKVRFWYFSGTPGNAWIIEWECRGDAPTVRSVPVADIYISRDPVEPPPMPEWAYGG
jgi:hypothetical protein